MNHAKPKIVCLCGSTKFKDEFMKAEILEKLHGHIVLTVEFFSHAEGIVLDPEIKQKLDELHLKKIDIADEVLIINVDGYVGESTRREIKYAIDHGKPVRWLEPDKAMPYEVL